jgi:hypothetical protein
MAGHVHIDDPPAVMPQHEEDEQNAAALGNEKRGLRKREDWNY